MLFHRVLTISYLSMLFFGILLPSGSIGNFNVKILLFIILILTLCAFFIFNEISIDYSFIITLLLVIFFFFVWSFIYFINGFSDISSLTGELKDFLVTILLVYISYLILKNNIIDVNAIIITIIYAVLLLILIHIILVGFIIIFDLSFESTFGVITNIFDVDIMTADITDRLNRAQFPNDIVIPFVLYFVLYSKELNIKLSPFIKYLFILVSFFVIFLTFSRYIWIITLLFIITALFYKKKYTILILLTIVTFYLISFHFEDILRMDIIQARFFSEAVESSDNIRAVQFDSLMDSFYDHYLIGNGIGSYVRNDIRSDKFPYSYELQWIAFLMKFGLIGMGILLIYVFLFLRICLSHINKHRGYLLICITLYFLGGFTNPYLLTSYAACSYILFMAVCFKIRSEALSANKKASVHELPG
jgi:hypothetical protein